MYLHDPYITPVHGSITSDYGQRVNPVTGVPQFHYGVDYGVAINTPVVASGDGVVYNVVYGDARAGNYVQIQHPDGFITAYLHLNTPNVLKGQRVQEGSVIGYSGATGAVTGAHLHWSMKNAQGNFVNPHDYENVPGNSFLAHIQRTELLAWSGIGLAALLLYKAFK